MKRLKINKRLTYLCLVFLLTFSSVFVGKAYGFPGNLGEFSIEHIVEEDGLLYLYATPSQNAVSYKAVGMDSTGNTVYEQTSESNVIELKDLYMSYQDTLTFQVYAYNKNGNYIISSNDYAYIMKDLSFGKGTEHYNEKGHDFVIGFDGNSNLANYTIDVYYENALLEQVPVVNNIAAVSHEVIDNLSGTVLLKLNKDGKRILNVFSLYANSPLVGNIAITNLQNVNSFSWDDLEIDFQGGENATKLQVNLYKNGALANRYETEYKKDPIILPATFFEENTDYTLELAAIYKDYNEIAKRVNALVHIGYKQTVKPVYVNYDYKHIKKGTLVSLKTNTEDADIYYTFDGSEPTTSSYLYNSPFVITDNVTIKTKAFRKNMYDSEVNTYDFNVGDKPLVVYLSPSNQYDNQGVIEAGYSTEKNEMNKIADYLKSYLESYGVKVYRNQPAAGINAWVEESNYVKSDLHLAIHSNASLTHDAHGIEMYVGKATSQSLSIANKIYNNLYEMYPYKDETSNRGVKYSGTSLGEANDSFLPCGTLIEIAYHDNYNDAKWIVDHLEEIARNIGDSILEYYQVK